MERKRQGLVSQDKGSLTQQQTKWIVTTTILIRRIYKTNSENAQSNSHRSMSHAISSCNWIPPLASSPTRNPTWRHKVLNTLFCLVSLYLLPENGKIIHSLKLKSGVLESGYSLLQLWMHRGQLHPNVRAEKT